MEDLAWPAAIDYASCAPEKRQVFETNFVKLITLQLLYVARFTPALYPISFTVVVVSCTRERGSSQTRKKDCTPSKQWCNQSPFDSNIITTGSVTPIALTR
jgi:hypothetical protein